MARSVSAAEAWLALERDEARLLDLRTAAERRRFGWAPGAPRVSLLRHFLRPSGEDTIYLCQHANRSKLTGRRGAAEVAEGRGGVLQFDGSDALNTSAARALAPPIAAR